MEATPLIFPIDVTDHNAVCAVVAEIDRCWGRVDVLFNNAGVWTWGTLDIPIQDFDRTLAVNLKAAFSFLQAVVPIMKRQGSGYIINLVCISAKAAHADSGVYDASKFALLGLTESVHRDLGEHVNYANVFSVKRDGEVGGVGDSPYSEYFCKSDMLPCLSARKKSGFVAKNGKFLVEVN